MKKTDLPLGPWEKGYQPSGIIPTDEIQEQREMLLDHIQEMMDAASALVEAVERYVCPKKGDKYCSRGEVLAKLAQLKKICL